MQQLSLPDVFVFRLLFSPDKFGRTVGLFEFDVGFQRFQMDKMCIRDRVSLPIAFLMARSMLSFGMFSRLQVAITPRRVGLFRVPDHLLLQL